MLYCTVLKYAGYTTYSNSCIWGFTLNKHTLYSTVLHCTELCWIYTTILILVVFTLYKHILHSTVLYRTGRIYPLDRIRMKIKYYSITNIHTLLTLLSWLSSLCSLHLSLSSTTPPLLVRSLLFLVKNKEQCWIFMNV